MILFKNLPYLKNNNYLNIILSKYILRVNQNLENIKELIYKL